MPQSAQLFAQYKVAGAAIKPENVFTARAFNFTMLRLWFGGGEFLSYAVDAQGKATEIDRVKIDLKRYGRPKVDQHKIPIPPQKGPAELKKGTTAMKATPKSADADSTVRSAKILDTPPPGSKVPLRNAPPRRHRVPKTAPPTGR
jgi:hypothetical protein